MGFTPRLLTPRLLTPRLPTSVNHGNVGPTSLDWSDYPQRNLEDFLIAFDGDFESVGYNSNGEWNIQMERATHQVNKKITASRSLPC